MNYNPSPIDTTAVHLPSAVDELIERLAEHNHHVWARGRLADGWVWGRERNDSCKHHPCLVEYDELPESEKEYDRHTAAEVLKAIVAMGFRIERAA